MSQANDKRLDPGQSNVRPLQSAIGRSSNPEVSDRPLQVGSSRVPDPEVNARPTPRKYTKEYKARILREVEQLRHGEVGPFLRQEGLYTSHITDWRKQRDQALEKWLAPQRPGPKPEPANALADELAKVKRENALLERKLKRAETIIEVQKKISEILSIPLNPPASDADDF
jgi:transposase